MMREETARKINELRAEVGNKMFSKEEASRFVSIQTLKKYSLIKAVKEVNREEVSIEELVAEVNSMLGEDCYGYNPGEYIYEDGKVYLETTSYGYRFK